ncbi:HugZ family pyridoxamine 5'-phosphate oxidase [Curvivirga aplysinae]|uniref:HugZ family pyridoxamine 5'-phosphate oxidase n=1 Tax=Curvivirga aplysinae TaxID=2529852 RepID=UPI0012BC1FB6|nr:DUF2470 domain-containing protein [Curvivirga aplysinae]MTI08654.1 DUF2470 domain-containing protein [Curvivirga aplysinae]
MANDQDIGKDIRLLLRGCDRASLAANLNKDQDQNQSAYVALVLVAFDMKGHPILFISNLAEHTKALKENPVCSLLLDGTTGLRNPLTGARATLQGAIEFLDGIEAEQAKTRYISRHHSARMYQDFPDFNVVRFNPTRAHLVAGFGKIHWINWADILTNDDVSELTLAETDIVTHMNEDHADVLNLIANKLLNRKGVGWQLTGVDPDGCDLQLEGQMIRYPFESLVYTADNARKEFVAAAKLARSS